MRYIGAVINMTQEQYPLPRKENGEVDEDALREHLEKLVLEGQRVEAENAHLHERLFDAERVTSMKREIVEALREARPPVTEVDVKAKEPELFSGRADELEDWLAQCELYFDLQARSFRTDIMKVKYATGCLRGLAAIWWKPHRMAETPPEWSLTWKAFADELRRSFGERDQRKYAQQRLENTRQTHTVAAYVAKFRQWIPASEWSGRALYDKFMDNLKPEIQRRIALFLDEPKTLEDLMQLAMKIDETERRLQTPGRRERLDSPRHAYLQQGASNNVETQFAPMDLGASKVSRGSYRAGLQRGEPRRGVFGRKTAPKLSPSEREHRLRLNLCFECGKDGHRAIDCPNRMRNSKTFVKLGATIDEEDSARDEDDLEDLDEHSESGKEER